MPSIKFITETEVLIKRLELDEGDHFTPISPIVSGVAQKDLPDGYRGEVILYLQGSKGQTAKFKVVQVAPGGDVVLEKRDHIKITSPKGKATCTVAFAVR